MNESIIRVFKAIELYYLYCINIFIRKGTLERRTLYTFGNCKEFSIARVKCQARAGRRKSVEGNRQTGSTQDISLYVELEFGLSSLQCTDTRDY